MGFSKMMDKTRSAYQQFLIDARAAISHLIMVGMDETNQLADGVIGTIEKLRERTKR
jgi:hypothetical protein